MRRSPVTLAVPGTLLALALASAPPAAQAAPVTFFGEDLNTTDALFVGDDPIPIALAGSNALAARDLFAAQVPSIAVENFESFSVGASPTSLSFSGDAASLAGSPKQIQTATNPNGTHNGTYATSGTKFLLSSANSSGLTVTFTQAQAAFGFYATDIGDGGGRLRLEFVGANGTVLQEVPSLANGLNSGSLYFFGYINTTDTFTQVRFRYTSATGDGFGLDDLMVGRASVVVPPSDVPEPSTLALAAAGGIAALRRGRRDRSAAGR